MDHRRSTRLITALGAAVAWVVVGAVAAVLATTSAAQAAVPATAPVAATAEVTELTPTTATLQGTVAPSEPTALTFFEWGFTSAYGRTTPEVHLAGAAPQAVAATLTGLVPGTTYHYRLLAANGTGTTRTADATFTTAAAASTDAAPPPAGAADPSGATSSQVTTPAPSPGSAGATPRPAALLIGNGGAAGVPTVSTVRVRHPVMRIPVTCASGPTCSGALAVWVPRRPTARDARTSAQLGSASFAIPSGTRVTLKIPITAAARSLIASAKHAGQAETAVVALDGQATTQGRLALANASR